MRLAIAVLPLLIALAACSDAADLPPSAAKSIALEFSASDTAAADKAQTECSIYGLTAKPRAAEDNSNQNTVIFDCQ
jgi:hypothetical protein